MRAAGFIGAEESVFERLENLNWTLAEKKDAVRYASGQIVEFHRMTKGAVRDGKRELKFLSGEQWRVKGKEGDSVIIERTAPQRLSREAGARDRGSGSGEREGDHLGVVLSAGVWGWGGGTGFGGNRGQYVSFCREGTDNPRRCAAGDC